MRLINGTVPTQPTFQSNIPLITLISKPTYIYTYIFESKEYCSHLPQLVIARDFEPMKKYYVEIFRINKTIIHSKYFALSEWL